MLYIQGHAIYSEIPPQLINKFKPYMEEGNIVYISKLGVEKAKPGYRVVDGPYMLKFGIRTEMIRADTDDTTFPKYVFSLTSIEDLSQYVGRTDRFLRKSNIFIMYIILHNISHTTTKAIICLCRCYWKNYSSIKCSSRAQCFWWCYNA